MPEYLTRRDVKNLKEKRSNEVYAEKLRNAQRRSPEGLTFLSHSSKDNDLIPVIIEILERQGATVYVDTKDVSLSSKPGREIAVALRERIRGCKKFIVFVTENIKDSKWVPWELGLSDGYKHTRNTAIFPTIEDNYQTSWLYQEYLEAYDQIVWGTMSGVHQPTWLVWNRSENTACTLSNWLIR